MLSSALPYSLDTFILRRITPRLYAIITSFGPVIAALFGWLVLSETFTRARGDRHRHRVRGGGHRDRDPAGSPEVRPRADGGGHGVAVADVHGCTPAVRDTRLPHTRAHRQNRQHRDLPPSRRQLQGGSRQWLSTVRPRARPAAPPNRPAPASPRGCARSSPPRWPAPIVEWYEFFLYATAATLVFNVILFPPSDNPLDNIIKAFLTYAVGFIARPLGGIVFGHFGDKYGRKKLLQLAIILVGVATFLMGCLPTFDQIGYLAPVLLVVAPLRQGFAVGGEWGGAVLLVAEHSPDKPRGFWARCRRPPCPRQPARDGRAAHPQSRTLTEEQFLAWGWRIGFWLSVVIVAVGYYIRTKVTDAPIFLEVQKEVEAAKKHELRRHRGAASATRAASSPRWASASPRTSCTTSS